MIEIPKIPKLPEKEELQFKEKEFLLSLYEQYKSSSKVFFYLFVLILILAVPLGFLMERALARLFIAAYKPSLVNEHPYNPQDIQIVKKAQILQVVEGVYSVYVELLNPNAELSAHTIGYELIIKDSQNQILKTITDESYLLAGSSRFLLFPTISLTGEPKSVELALTKVKWTRRVPPNDIALEILQKDTGVTLEGQFFVEGILHNPHGYGFDSVKVGAAVFDQKNQNIKAINSTVLNDLKFYENRYFRMIWPISFSNIGQVQIIPEVNPFDPRLIYEEGEEIPAR